MSQHETPATVFGWTNVPFRQNKAIKFEIFTSWLTGTKLREFFSGLNWKSGVSFTPNFLWAFQCLKMKPLLQFLVEPMYLLEKTRRWATEILGKIWIVVFHSAYTKIVKFLRAGKKVKISNFIGWFCLKDKLLGQKTDTAFRAMKSFSTIWILVSNSDPQNGWIFFEQARRDQNFKFYQLVLCKR